MRSLRTGEDVLATDGSRLGRIQRIVVDENGRQVTHIVVKGRAIPAGRLRDAGRDGLAADLTEADLRALPDASEPPFAAPGAHWQPPEGFALEDFLAFADAFNRVLAQGPFQPPIHVETGASLLHEIDSGSPVWCGNHLVGRVDRLLWEDDSKVSGLVVRHGFPAKLTQVPVADVREVVGNNVHLQVDAESFRRLPKFDRSEPES